MCALEGLCMCACTCDCVFVSTRAYVCGQVKACVSVSVPLYMYVCMGSECAMGMAC